jgi:protein-S-isoprenylcysteine O-methyltransferase Ste14
MSYLAEALPFFVAASLLALPALYTWVWWRPAHFLRCIGRGRDPCAAISTTVHVVKVVQGLLLAVYVDWTALPALPVASWLLGLVLILAGQYLNVRVYQLLGHDGVYYGSIFGKRIKWISAWPYSHLRNPQYAGCILTVLGTAAIILPARMAAFWCAIYVYAAWLESTPHPAAEVRALRETFGISPARPSAE